MFANMFVMESRLLGGVEAVTLDEPRAVVASFPVMTGVSQFLDAVERLEPKQLLFEGADYAF